MIKRMDLIFALLTSVFDIITIPKITCSIVHFVSEKKIYNFTMAKNFNFNFSKMIKRMDLIFAQ